MQRFKCLQDLLKPLKNHGAAFLEFQPLVQDDSRFYCASAERMQVWVEPTGHKSPYAAARVETDGNGETVESLDH